MERPIAAKAKFTRVGCCRVWPFRTSGWIPRLPDRRPGIEMLAGAGNWYGTTLRIYDPELDAWRILWSDPATNFFTQQIARQQGQDIVQTGPDQGRFDAMGLQ